jgi:tetratricopeptide (TPR) repeat protein
MADSRRIDELKRRVQLDPASIAFAALAEEYRRTGQYEESIATCQAGLQRHPAYLSARVTLGRSLLELGRYEDAREQLEHVLRVAPENLAAIRGLAEIHHRTGDLPEVVEPGHGGTGPEPVPASAPASEPAAPVASEPPPHPAEQRDPEAEPPVVGERSAPAPRPVRVQLSKLTASDTGESVSPAPSSAVVHPSAPEAAGTAAPGAAAAAPPQARQPSHPDERALPALEAMLAAILRARDSLPSDGAFRH